MPLIAPINEVDMFESFEVNGMGALMTYERVDRNTIPEGYYAYDVRGTDDDGGGTPASIENHVFVNFYGTLITREPLNIPESGFIPLEDGKWGYVDRFSEFGNKFAYSPHDNMWTYVA